MPGSVGYLGIYQECESYMIRNKHRVTFLPFDLSVDIPEGASLLDAIREAHLPFNTTCGGEGTCGDCIVHISKGAYKAKPSAALPERLLTKNYALACLTEVRENLVVQLPRYEQLSIQSVTDSRFFEDNKANISGICENDPIVKTFDLRLPPPSLEDNYSDLRRLQRELHKVLKTKEIDCEYSVLKILSQKVREEQGEISAVVLKTGDRWTIIDVEPGITGRKIYGIACDIGTTTVALQLIDLKSGSVEATASDYNQQIKCGEDVISRINYSQRPGHLQELHELIVATINHLIEKAAESIKIVYSDIYYASISGNTTMIHLFLNLEPRYIREEPYVPTLNDVSAISSHDIGLKMNPEGKVDFAPAVGSYVGGDITAGLLCTPINRSAKKVSLFIDVGTNGELVIGNKDWLMTCACSAGPAFEGGEIKCGMPASGGSIEKIKLTANGEVEYQVIGDTKPKGLCGSGLIDLLAELFFHGYIDRHGKFKTERAIPRIVETENGRGFLIEKGDQCYWGNDLVMTENDITTLIRTKGAVFSACSLLLKNVGITFDEIDAFYIAGGFGQHLNIENAIRIGLLPDMKRNKFHYLGNSSLLGAYLLLLSEKNRTMVHDIAGKMTYIELNTELQYMNEYTGALFLPHTNLDLFPSVKKIL
jgi:uncharacterized 2Fe-2S/4Fe-4S cluster protein (DUF4445 family)